MGEGEDDLQPFDAEAFAKALDGGGMNPQIRRLALDLGPLLMFFAGFQFCGHLWRHRHLHGRRSLAALALGWHLERKLSPMPLFTAVLVLIFGGLTLYLKNDIFIKMKPTVLYAILRRHAAGRTGLQPAFHQICFRRKPST